MLSLCFGLEEGTGGLLPTGSWCFFNSKKQTSLEKAAFKFWAVIILLAIKLQLERQAPHSMCLPWKAYASRLRQGHSICHQSPTSMPSGPPTAKQHKCKLGSLLRRNKDHQLHFYGNPSEIFMVSHVPFSHRKSKKLLYHFLSSRISYPFLMFFHCRHWWLWWRCLLWPQDSQIFPSMCESASIS